MKHPITNHAGHRQAGFTMIELMIAVAIVGILASLAITAFDGAVIRARVAEGLSLASNMKVTVVDNLISDAGGDACSGITDLMGPVGSVQSITCQDDGTAATIHVALVPDAGNVEVDFIADRASVFIWRCQPSAGFEDYEYLPSGCR